MAGEPAVAASEEGPDPAELIRSRAFLALLALAAVVGVVVSLIAWGFLEALHEIEHGVYESLPDALGFSTTPDWWSLPVLLVGAVIVAYAVARLPGRGGHVPVHGLDPSPSEPIELPGIVIAALAGIGLGAVVGPEAPLIALGGGIGLLTVRRLAREAPESAQTLVAAAGLFASISFLFGSPLVAAVLLVEAAGLDRRRLTLVLIPGLLAAGIGSLVSTGMGSWTGVDTATISIMPLQLDHFPRPSFVDFVWTVPLAAAIAVGTKLIFSVGRCVDAPALRRPFVILPAIALVTSLLAIGFDLITDKGPDQVLFSGETALDPLVSGAAGWSLGALALLIAVKGLVYGLALGSFRGGPVFPALFLGAAAGLMAARLPGFELTPAVAVGMGAATVAVLRLPLSSVVLAVLLTASAGLGPSALIIVGVVVSLVVTIALDGSEAQVGDPAPTAAAPTEPRPASG